MNRRNAIKIVAGGAALATGLYTWQIEPHWLEISRSSLPIKGLPAHLNGNTLAQLSDLHIGREVDDNYLKQSFARVSRLAPDFVVITGDWVTYRGSHQFDQLARVLEHLPHGKFATVGILGNHDYGTNWSMREVGDRISVIAKNAGVNMLRNESLTVAGLQFLGLEDLWGPYFYPRPLLAQKSQDPATLVLCHNPDAADLDVWSKYSGWILAGHTHGGQCKPPFLPPPIVPVKNPNYISGAVPLTGGRNMYISRGVGHLLKVRFNARPEIPLFELKSANV